MYLSSAYMCVNIIFSASIFLHVYSDCLHYSDNIFVFIHRWKKYLQEVKPSYWVLIVRDNGSLEIYSLPDFRLSYLVRNFGLGLRVLVDSLGAAPMPVTNPGNSEGTAVGEAEVREILMVALGHHGSRPLLIVRLEDELLLYEVYRYPRGFLKMRFRRIQHNVMIHDKNSRY